MSLARFNLEPAETISAGYVALVGLSLYFARGRHKLRKQNERLEYEATHDKMTGFLNVRGLEDLLAKDKPPQALLYVDGTNQKGVNDTISHARGDDAIIGTADVLKTSLRPTDVVARIGGDEFLVLLDTERRESEDALSPGGLLAPVITRIGDETRTFLANNNDLLEAGFNIAVGGAVWQEGMAVEDLRSAAEANMYVNKREQHELSGQYRS